MNRAVVLPLFFAVAGSADARSPTIEPGDGFEVVSYAVALRPDLATTAVSGTQTNVVRGASDQVTRLAFTANALRISEATVDAAPVQVSSSKDAIVFTLPRALHEGAKAKLRLKTRARRRAALRR